MLLAALQAWIGAPKKPDKQKDPTHHGFLHHYSLRTRTQNSHVYTHICYIQIYMSMSICICTYIYIYTHTYVQVYVVCGAPRKSRGEANNNTGSEPPAGGRAGCHGLSWPVGCKQRSALLRGLWGGGGGQKLGPFLEVPIRRILTYLDLCWGPEFKRTP